MSRLTCPWLGLLSAWALCACSGSGGSDGRESDDGVARASVQQTPVSSISTDSIHAAVNANNAFALDLYTHVLADSTGGNVLTSPISASLALTMTYVGAQGDTAAEMARALHIDSFAAQDIFDGQDALSQTLMSRAGVALAEAQTNAKANGHAAPTADQYQFEILNSLWGQKGYKWAEPFLTTLAQDYGAGVHQEDFVNAYEPARAAINAWVSDATKGKLNGLLPQGSLDSLTRFVLVDAMHLKFPWATPFDVASTRRDTFTLGNGSTIDASLMNQTNSYAYADDGMAQIASIPFAHGDLTLLVALPHEGVGLSSYEAALAANPAALSVPASSALVQLALPKVQFTTDTFSLTGALSKMGMAGAFMPGANFSGMCQCDLHLKDVLQKAMIALDETGGEAAAATAVIGGTLAIAEPEPPPPTPIPMIVNRPYLIALVDEPTGAVLMVGHIVDPSSAGSP